MNRKGESRPAPHRGYRRARSTLRRVLVQALFGALERLLPAERNTWCFASWPARHWHTLDNPRAVFERVKHDPAIRKVVLGRGAAPAGWRDGANVHFVRAESLQGMYWVARAGVLVLGYSVFALSSYGRLITHKHRLVQVWHGIPLKRIGHLFPGESWWEEETPRYAATVCSAERDREIMAQAFRPLPRERVWLTGLPRNDFITGSEAELPADYAEMLGALRAQLQGRRLVLYAPTWREAAENHYAFSAEEIAALERVLAKHGAVLGVRGHSNVRRNAAYAADYGSAAVVNVNELPDVNLALRVTDVLITDYSSIYIDFLLTDRPVLHFTYDLSGYETERGFLYRLEDAFAAPPACTFPELLAQLDRVLADPNLDAERRAAARQLFHTHGPDAGAAVATRIRALAGPGERP